MIGRYKEPVELEVVARYAVRERKARPRKPWRLKDSIWAPRAKWADSKDFWDTDATERAMFEGDWADAVACGISKYILRMDDDDDEVSSHGEDDEVSETMGVLWQYHDLLYTIFDYYAATGSGDDFTQIRMNSFREFVNDCALADKHSKFCKPTHFDQLVRQLVSITRPQGRPIPPALLWLLCAHPAVSRSIPSAAVHRRRRLGRGKEDGREVQFKEGSQQTGVAPVPG